MRLTPQEIQAFVSALSPYLEQTEAELRLYGSRTAYSRLTERRFSLNPNGDSRLTRTPIPVTRTLILA